MGLLGDLRKHFFHYIKIHKFDKAAHLGYYIALITTDGGGIMAQQKINKSDPVSIRFAPNVRDELSTLATRMGVNPTDIIRIAVKEYIERNIELATPVDRIASAVVEQLLAKGLVGNIGAHMGSVKEDEDGE